MAAVMLPFNFFKQQYDTDPYACIKANDRSVSSVATRTMQTQMRHQSVILLHFKPEQRTAVMPNKEKWCAKAPDTSINGQRNL